MQIFNKEFFITENDDKTNICFHFDVPNGISKLIIHYEYSPKTLGDTQKATSIINKKLKEYGNDEETEDFLPLSNLITISLDKNGEYIGAAHRQPNVQQIEISPDTVTPGFFKTEVENSKWQIVLNVHCAMEKINVKLNVTGVER